MNHLLAQHYRLALAEIGGIDPYWSDEDGLFVFEHALYPRVVGGGSSVEEARASYERALQGFIEARLTGILAETAHRVTKGRGGVRTGAGRPKGSAKTPKTRIYVIEDLGHLLKNNLEAQQIALAALRNQA